MQVQLILIVPGRHLVNLLFLVIPVVAVTAAFFRYREHFYALESATDSKRGHTFWTVLALLYAIVIAACYFIFY
jgi:hypothetical protein